MKRDDTAIDPCSGEKMAVFLRSDVQIEPLVNQWYAWIHLFPPFPAAMNIVERHIPTTLSMGFMWF